MTFEDGDTFAKGVNSRFFFDMEREGFDGKEGIAIMRLALARGWKIDVPEVDLLNHERRIT